MMINEIKMEKIDDEHYNCDQEDRKRVLEENEMNLFIGLDDELNDF